MAYKITNDLAKVNLIIVSGMARGIDAMAHKGILEAGGKTIAVLGCGVDVCYPRENEKLMKSIIENGCLISEYPPQTRPLPRHFPQRNRIISGISKMLVVVEAGVKSGTLITVDLALEQGRDVFAVPGNATSPKSAGTNNLLKQGCIPLTEGKDILNELNIAYQVREKIDFKKKVVMKLSEETKQVYQKIPMQRPIQAQDIANELGQLIQEIQYHISLLEIAGLIKKDGYFGYMREV